MFEMLLSPSPPLSFISLVLLPFSFPLTPTFLYTPTPFFPSIKYGMEKDREGLNRCGDHVGTMQNHWILPLPLLALPSVPLVSDDKALLRELRLASQGMASRRGGIRSLMRSSPLASSKLLILCWGEKPLIAVVEKKKDGLTSICSKFTQYL